jgi:4,5-dihydroxyphthalate decarboxylase
MLGAGVIDAAIVDPVPAGDRYLPVMPDPEAGFRAWQQRFHALTVNHVIVVRESLAHDAIAMHELFRLFRDSRAQAGSAIERIAPIGFEANRRNLEVAIDVASAQGLLARPLTVDDLVTDVLATLN